MARRNQTYDRLVDESYDTVLSILKHKQFLDKKGLANDLPFFICPYEPDFKNRAKELRTMFVRELTASNINVLDLNLYDTLISILKADDYFDMLIEREGSIEKDEFLEIVQNLVSPEERLVPTIGQIITDQNPDIFFLSGLGEVYPFLRPHSILSHLQARLSDQLTLMFFPGDYNYTETSGATLDIFGLKQEERYYRAFNIFEYEV